MSALAPLTTLRTKEEYILRLLDEATSAANEGDLKGVAQLLTQAVYSAKPTADIHRECNSVLAALIEA